MSDSQQFLTPLRVLNVGTVGDVQHVGFLSEHIGSLYLNDSYSDIVLIVDGNQFHAHKVILAVRSEYFR